jgi:uncharacterized protein (DUF302 family)
MKEFSYGFSKTLTEKTFEDAVNQTTAALKAEGFGVLTEIDVQSTLKKKLNRDFRRYLILGACNPPLAHKVLEAEPPIGLLLPCNVVVQETPNRDVEVSIASPKAMFTLVENSQVAPIAQEVEDRLRRVLTAI